MKQIGKKGKLWQQARRKLIKEALIEGRFTLKDNVPYGLCEDCQQYKYLSPDHKIKRSQGGGHEAENIEWVCIPCHDKRDNLGDPMNKKPKSKKPAWQREHDCKKCGKRVNTLLCPYCGYMSM